MDNKNTETEELTAIAPDSYSSNDLSSKVVENQPVSSDNTTVSKNSKRKKILIVSAILTILAALIAVYFITQGDDAPQTQDNTQSTATDKTVNKENEQKAATGTNVPEQLLRQNQAKQGFAVGYIRLVSVPKKSSRINSFFFKKVLADVPEYQTAIFYKNNSPDGNQIFAYNVTTKESTQITSGNSESSNPVFSSVSQKLAYNQDSCTVAIKDLAQNTDIVIQKQEDTNTCYKPSAWSPDGKYLAYIGTTRTQSDLGLVSFGQLHLYDTATGKSMSVKAPEGLNSVHDATVFWRDATNVVADYVQYGKYASVLRERIVNTDTTTLGQTSMPTQTDINFGSIQIAGDTLYVIGEQPQALLNGSLDDKVLQNVPNSENATTFLLKSDSNSKVSDIYTLAGQAGTENSFKLNSLPANGAQATTLFSPKGFSAYLLGWGEDYDEIIYMNVASGKSELHQYTISTNTDKVLVGNLPLIQ